MQYGWDTVISRSKKRHLPVKKILKILKRYRGKSSIWFFTRAALISRQARHIPGLPFSELLKTSGLYSRDINATWNIYHHLNHELGPIKASAAVLEILVISGTKQPVKIKKPTQKRKKHRT